MSFNIIVRQSGYSSKKKSMPHFHKHFNREIVDAQHPNGTMIYTKEQYYGELKRRGLEPYDHSAKDCAKIQPVTMSEDTKKTIQAINEQTHKGKFTPSGRLLDKMASKGVKIRPTDEDLKKLPSCYKEGGISNDQK